jgi:hypothetical protein
MTQETKPYAVDSSRLLALANEKFGEVVDSDMRGTPITKAAVLLHGAYGRAVIRLINLAVQRYRNKEAALDMSVVSRLAKEAFAQAEDLDFGGNILTDYSIVLKTGYAFGETTLKLVNLALERHAELRESSQG